MRWSVIADRWSDIVHRIRGTNPVVRWARFFGGIAVLGMGLFLVGIGVFYQQTVWIWIGIPIALVGVFEFYIGLHLQRRQTD